MPRQDSVGEHAVRAQPILHERRADREGLFTST